MAHSFKLSSNDELTSNILDNGIIDFESLTVYIKRLPYGRNKNRKDITLVWKEQKGTCSSKHAFLKHIAELNNIPNVELLLGMYKMNTTNTPKIGNVLSEHQLEYIPEAHCYLKIGDERLDFTSINSNFKYIENDILLEKIIAPQQVVEFKVDFHKAYLKRWMQENDIPFSFEELWKIREQCIVNLGS